MTVLLDLDLMHGQAPVSDKVRVCDSRMYEPSHIFLWQCPDSLCQWHATRKGAWQVWRGLLPAARQALINPSLASPNHWYGTDLKRLVLVPKIRDNPEHIVGITSRA